MVSSKSGTKKTSICCKVFDAQLTVENKQKLKDFVKLRSSCLVDRFRTFCKLKPYRQTTLGNIALFMAVLLKKL
nr:Uncharacterised protein [Raoultella sp. NCTC 9187]